MRRILAFTLAMMLLIPCIAIPASAEDEPITGTVTGNLTDMQYSYRDSYFTESASVYNPSLATMSVCLASINASISTPKRSSKLLQTLQAIGFTDAEANPYYDQRPEMDGIGVAVAHREIHSGGEDFTVLAVVSRGVAYTAEWGNNFVIGTKGEAEGFSESAATVEAFVAEYVKKYGSSFEGTLKLWLTGFSRGAAVANLTAGHFSLAEKVGTVSVERKNIFCYTFEAPCAVTEDVCSREKAQSLTNIHNITASNDLIPKVAPKGWGFFRYGTDESVIPEVRTAENAAIFEAFVSALPETLTTTDASGKRIAKTETFQARSLIGDPTALLKQGLTASGVKALLGNSDKTCGQVMEDFVLALSTAVGSRCSYVKNLEGSFRILFSEIMGSGYQSQVVWQKAAELLSRKLKDREDELLAAALTSNALRLNYILNGIVTETAKEADLDTAAYHALVLHSADLVAVLVKTVLADGVIDNFTDVLSVLENLDALFYTHYPEQVYAWMHALDPAFNANLPAQTDVRVTAVQVNTESIRKSVYFFLRKREVSACQYTITPASGAKVSDIAYRTAPAGPLVSGSVIKSTTPISYLYIRVTDANGHITFWEYRGGFVSRVA